MLPEVLVRTDCPEAALRTAWLELLRTVWPEAELLTACPEEELVRIAWLEDELRTAVPLAEPLEVRTLEAETLLTEVIDMSLPLVDVVAVPEDLLTDDDEPAFLLTVEDATPIPFPLLLSVRPLLP